MSALPPDAVRQHDPGTGPPGPDLRAFRDPQLEAQFRAIYRELGLDLTQKILVIALLGYIAFILAEFYLPVRDSDPLVRQTIRWITVAAIASYLIASLARPTQVMRHFVAGASAVLMIILYGAAAMAILSPNSTEMLFDRIIGSLIITTLFAYGFTRLPVAIIAGVSISAALGVFASLIGSAGSSEQLVRLCLHVAIANAGGFLLSRNIERRERVLFLQRLALEDAVRRAALASASKSRLLAAIGHDYRQPLAAILQYVEELAPVLAQLRATPRDPALVGHDPAESLARIKVCAQTLRGQLTRMLEYASLDQDDRPLPMQAVDLCGLFERLRDVYEPLAAEHHVQLRIVIPPSGQAMVLAHAERLWESVANLVANGIRFADPAQSRARWVLVCATRMPETVRISVRDNGIGIDAHELERIWDTGYRVRAGASSGVSGYGLGLAQVDTATRRMSGHQRSVRSVRHRGSCFTIRTPRVLRAAGSDEAQGQILAQLTGGYGALLVKSDSQRLALMRTMAGIGMSFETTSDLHGLQSLLNSGERTPDILVVDRAAVSMADIRILTERLRTRVDRSVPCIVLDYGPTALPMSRLPAGVYRLRGVVSARSLAECLHAVRAMSGDPGGLAISIVDPNVVAHSPDLG